MVHYHFASLPALLNEAVVGVMRQMLAELAGFLGAAGTPAEAVELMLASLGLSERGVPEAEATWSARYGRTCPRRSISVSAQR